jgi:nicotinamide-nucleotide amidase
MKGEIIAIGDELISGRVLNTTSTFAAARLLEAGHEIKRITVIGDEPEIIDECLHASLKRAAFVLISGGLGPTSDDITNEAVARALGLRLVENAHITRKIQEMERRTGHKASRTFKEKLSMLPEGARLLNPDGCAAGYELDYEGVYLFFLPGVPDQLKDHLVKRVIPRLNELDPRRREIRQKVFRLFGLTEMEVNERLYDLYELDSGIRIGYYPVFPEVHLSITVKGEDGPHVDEVFEQAVAKVEAEFKADIVAMDGGTLEATIGELLTEKGLMLSAAESCTGGLLGKRVTDVPGSSAWFDRSIVTYSNRAKMEELGVSAKTLDQYGAVSSQTAREMVAGIRRVSGTQCAIAITGIAGPGGGTPEKPVGTVFIALSVEDEIMVHRFLFPGSRHEIRSITSETALDWLRRYLAYGSKLPGYRFES